MEQTPLRIDAIEDVGPDSIAVRFETPTDFSARPGQFVKLTLAVDGEDESRFYTISSPDTEGTFETTIEIDPDGELGPVIAALETGDEVRVSGPFGNAYYEDEPSVVVLAGGPGVGPAVGIGERAVGDGGQAAIVYRDDTPIHQDRLEALDADGAVVSILAEAEDLTDDVAAAFDAVGEDAQVFVYGFADFLDAATDAIGAAGGNPDAAKVENFG